MGEKSRGNWLVEWCALVERGCLGNCDRCVRQSKNSLGRAKLPGKGRGKKGVERDKGKLGSV